MIVGRNGMVSNLHRLAPRVGVVKQSGVPEFVGYSGETVDWDESVPSVLLWSKEGGERVGE